MSASPAETSTFQGLILTLQAFWAKQGCLILQPYDMEVGAGLIRRRSLRGWPAPLARRLCAAFAASDWMGAMAEPNRLQHYYQYQVILKPSPDDVQDIYLESLKTLASIPSATTSALSRRLGEPTLAPGAWAEVWCDGTG